MFILLVAAEVPRWDQHGRNIVGCVKHNIELGFPERPSLADFVGHCEATFRCEVARLRPPNAPLHRFIIDSVKIFDDTLNRWVDLASAHQLVEWSQLYVFQPSVDASSTDEESQAVLQPPVRIRSAVEVGRNKDKFFFLFHDMDFNGNGHLNRDEVQRIFNVMGCFQISERQVDAMFQQFDTNRDGVLSYAEFAKWMTAMPDTAEMLLRKSLEYWESFRLRRPDIRDSSEISAQERASIEQYLERCRASAAANPASAQRARSIKEMEDERLLLEREEELRRARDNFRHTYQRELGVPSTAVISSGGGGGGGAGRGGSATRGRQVGAGGGGVSASKAATTPVGGGGSALRGGGNSRGGATPQQRQPDAAAQTPPLAVTAAGGGAAASMPINASPMTGGGGVVTPSRP